MYILGLNAYHGDSSACLLRENEILCAVEEERFKRVKHWAGFPLESIKYCLDYKKISLSDISHIAINTSPNAHLLKKINYTIFNKTDLKFILKRLKNRRERSNIRHDFSKYFPDFDFTGTFHFIEHHYSHLASTHYTSPFNDSVCVSIDGFGDFSSGAWGIGSSCDIQIRDRIFFPHSLGIFYQALTQYLGFPYYGDEYKVMGLAPYGKPSYLNNLRKVVLLTDDGKFKLNLPLFNHHNGGFSFEWSGSSPEIGNLFSEKLVDIIGLPPRRKNDPLNEDYYNLAHSVQAMYEEAFFNILNYTHQKTGLKNLTLAGGCAMNSVANGKVYRRTSFKNLYVQSAAGDAGGAIGAAYAVAEKLDILRSHSKRHMSHAYYGPEFSLDNITETIRSNESELINNNCSFEILDDSRLVCTEVAKKIADGQVVGWFQGRMEWGPRALGNRSILGDPRRADMKEILNKKIKRRESFRPFAPSILREKVSEWFEEDDDVPFMMQVFQVNESKRERIPAVTHVDGSGRLQTVDKLTNPLYYDLINEFGKITGVPIVLNTSFNENEPVVCQPQEALDCFIRTKMDVLVIGNWIIFRK